MSFKSYNWLLNNVVNTSEGSLLFEKQQHNLIVMKLIYTSIVRKLVVQQMLEFDVVFKNIAATQKW